MTARARAVLLALLAAFVSEVRAERPDVSGLSPFSCPGADSAPPEDSSRVACGRIVVEHGDAQGRGRVEIAVAVIRAAAPSGAPPLVYLHGGPGGSAVHSAIRAARRSLFQARDVVFFDQRGSGLSRPVLCAEGARAFVEIAAEGLPATEERRRLGALDLACRDRLIAEGVDLGRVNTMTTVADMEAVRSTLKIERWDVFGVSYGTTVALAYLATHPGRVRAAILDSVYPPDRPAFARTIPNFMHAYGQIAKACVEEAKCRSAFPDPVGALEAAVEGLEREPLALGALEADIGGEKVRLDNAKLNASTFLAVIHQATYDRGLQPILPLLVELTRRRNAAAWRSLMPVFAQRAGDVNQNVTNAVECFERLPFEPPLAVEGASAPWPALARNWTLLTRNTDVCRVWGYAATEPLPRVSPTAVPVLVLANAWDPITPASDARRVSQALGPTAQLVVAPQGGHGAIPTYRCASDIAVAFLADPARPVDRSCLGGIPPTRFAASAALYSALAPLLQDSLSLEPSRDVTALGAALAALATFVVWPLAWLVRPARGGRWRFAWRSSFWIGAGAAALIAWVGLFGWRIRETMSEIPALLAFGTAAAPPIEALYAAAAFGGLGALLWLVEAVTGRAHPLGAIHRLATLAAGAAFVWQAHRLGLLLPGAL